MIKSAIGAFLCVFSVALSANDEVLTLDAVSVPTQILTFDNEAKRYPEQSEFAVLHAVAMSSESGKRMAVVTVQNQASGSRILQADQLMALFADGQRVSPRKFPRGIKLEDGEQRTLTIDFGNYIYPILAVYSSVELVQE